MEKPTLLKLIAALGLLAVAGYLMVRHFQLNPGISEKAYFYDLSEKKLFVGPRTAIPPIRGMNDAALDAVRAVVIATNGDPQDQRSRSIAYLEMYSPELKKQMELAQTTGTSPPMGRGLAQEHRFVRRLGDTNWYSLASSEGEKIVGEWLTAGPGGGPAAVCTP